MPARAPAWRVLRLLVALLGLATTTGHGLEMQHDAPATDGESAQASLFGENVLVFNDRMEMADIQARLDAIHAAQARAEFTDRRYALLFEPGRYELEITVDYYVHAIGLGSRPGDVLIRGAVQSTSSTTDDKVTIMFWRGAENFEVEPTADPMLWAVSQAAPLRRMHIRGNVQFDRGGWASGGLLANSIVEGHAGLTTGQQWFTRNARIGAWRGGNWNRVFVGVQGAPGERWPDEPTTVVDRAPVIREKPFLTIDREGRYGVFVPALRHDARGVSWEEQPEAGERVPLEAFHVARPGTDDAASINAALASGKHLLLTPGIYELDDALRIDRPDTIVLGIGLPTLIPVRGQSALRLADVGGIKLAGVMIDAGLRESDVLVQVGERGADADHAANPTSLHDVYCRVGGALPGTARTCLEINSHHVIGDHFWLWRADHGSGAEWDVNRSAHGLVVNGDDVTIYGLFNEHFQSYQTLWRGERGRTYFYQSEIPYDPPDNQAWSDQGRPGFASYKVDRDVERHEAWGLGIYSFFEIREAQAKEVRVENSVEAPDEPGIRIRHIVNFATRSGGINHVVNGRGPATQKGELTLFDGLNHGSPAGNNEKPPQ